MVKWHHRLSRHEFEQIREDSEGMGYLACCGPWDHKESDIAERLNNYQGVFLRKGINAN